MSNVDPEEIRLGDFTKPAVPPKQPAQSSPTAEKLSEAENALKKEADEAEKSLKPMASYEDRLKEIGVTREQAAHIVDEVLLKGSYSEEIPLTSRITVRFRTRLYRDTQRMQSYLEVARPTYEAHYNEIIFKYSLAASIVKFGSDVFDHPGRKASGEEIEKSFQTRLTFVENLPDVTLRLLYTKLGKFDNKIRICLEEGAIENF